MKKKLLAILVSTAMIATALVGCGSEKPAEAPAADAPAAEADASSGDDAAAVPAPSGDVDLSNLKVGVLINTTRNDGGWCECQCIGIEGAKDMLGLSDDQIVYIEGVAEDTIAASNAVEQLVDEGCNMIFGVSTGYAPVLNELYAEYPEVMFVQVGVPVENITTYHVRAYDAMYSIGYLVAKMSDTDELGYVAGMSEASVRFSINAFALGAKAANENATVNLLWANSWYDPAAEGECAKTLASNGMKYIATGCSSPGVAQTCSEQGAFTTGYNLDVTDYAPDAVLVSCVWNWAPIMAQIMTDYAANGYQPLVESLFWGAEHGCAQMAYNDALVSPELQAEANAVLESIANGEFAVFDGPLTDNEGNLLVEEGATMSDEIILDQSFLVDNVNGTW
ncbi:MAG: BMP family ABC transporter substrate-binding protein [Lachnospiraceae bacterium]|nr:BMP family ABC transporter substrate-binding protein [Lachnospiraceae bacterium]